MVSAAAKILDIVIPAYNEAANLALNVQQIVAEVQHCGMHPHIILIDDGSTDDTWNTIRHLHNANSAITGIRLSRHFGKNSAIFAGLSHVKGDAALTIDADGQHPISALPAMLEHWCKGSKIVHGRKNDHYGDTAGKRIFVHLFYWLASALSGANRHGSSDFILLDRQVVKILLDQYDSIGIYRFRVCAINAPGSFVDIHINQSPRPSRWSICELYLLALRTLMYHSAPPVKITVAIASCVFLTTAYLIASAVIKGEPTGGTIMLAAGSLCLMLLSGSGLLVYLKDTQTFAFRKPSSMIAEIIGNGSISGT